MEAASGESLKESNKIARLLSTLPKTFGPLVVAIQTLNDNDLNLAFVKMRLLDHEIQINNENKDTSHKVLQTVSTAIKHNKKYHNHKKGYNVNFKNKNRQKQIKCYNCGKIGHYKRNCYLKNKNFDNNNENKTAQIVQNENIAFMCDRDINYEAEEKITFIIDSGSSDHIINDQKLFECYEEINPPLKIAIAKNGTYIDATKRGRVTLTTNRNISVTPNKVVVARDVIVDELNYGKSRPDLQYENLNIEDGSTLSESMTNDIVNPAVIVRDINVESEVHCKKIKLNETAPECMVRCMSDNEEDMGSSENVVTETNPMEPVNVEDTNNESMNKIRKSERIKNLPKISYDEMNEMIMSAELFVSDIPKYYTDIEGRVDQKQWEKAIKEEINSLKENNTWTVVPRPTDKNIVGCRWVFVIKNDENGNRTKYKARLVAKGYSQEYMSDYEETFAPVARITSFRFLIAFANQYRLLIHHMDVKTAFLNGKLKEEIYMEIPEGIECESNSVCRLRKSLYGLKQAARCWFEVFESTLLKIGFTNSAVDRCIYFLNKGDVKENIYLILYVDDIVIVTASIEKMNKFKNYLKANFKMTDLNDIKLFLGIRVQRKDNQITLDQTAYINRILEKFNMQDCNAVLTPLQSKVNFELLNKEENMNFPCRNLIGSLMYVMLCTRPDLSVAVNILSRYTNKNNTELWKNLKRLLRYLKGTSDMKLTYIQNNYENILSAFVDSDWGGDPIDRKSTTGLLFRLFDKNTICWITKRQASVAASSTEAEYMALYEAVREGIWLKSLSKSIGLDIENPITIFEDNQGCISIAKNPTSHKRSKHIDIKYHFSREQVEKNVINVLFISTDKQLADVLTKSLPSPKFVSFVKQLGLN